MPENVSGESRAVDLWMESTLESVDRAENVVLEVAAQAGFEEAERDRLGMAVRESMVNAVVHGNRYSSQKKVHFSVSSNGDRLVIEIADQGDGFDPESLPDPLAEENLLRQSGRGILLIRAFVDEFQIRRAEPAGMAVRLVKRRGRTA